MPAPDPPRAPMTIIICSRGRRRRCERVTLERCPDCKDLVDLASKVAHQCALTFEGDT